jgi:hypothetical protein
MLVDGEAKASTTRALASTHFNESALIRKMRCITSDRFGIRLTVRALPSHF